MAAQRAEKEREQASATLIRVLHKTCGEGKEKSLFNVLRIQPVKATTAQVGINGIPVAAA
jgi:hypothetical protein